MVSKTIIKMSQMIDVVVTIRYLLYIYPCFEKKKLNGSFGKIILKRIKKNYERMLFANHSATTSKRGPKNKNQSMVPLNPGNMTN